MMPSIYKYKNLVPQVSTKVLIADDDKHSLYLMGAYLKGEGIQVITAKDGVEACQALKANPNLDLIVLDRIMPIIDGLEFMNVLRHMPGLNTIPVIMQTAAAAAEQTIEGLESGALHYLHKPYTREIFLAHVHAALRVSRQYDRLMDNGTHFYMRNVFEALFMFRELYEAESIIDGIAYACPSIKSLRIGLTELMRNAIEHGRMGIKFEKKRETLRNGTYLEELKKRSGSALEVPATLHFQRTTEEIIITIADPGPGFDWVPFLHFDAARATEPNGRGIAIANKFGFDSIEYIAPGNKVICRIKNQKSESVDMPTLAAALYPDLADKLA